MRNGFTLIELPKAASKGFTLIELLVVITIIVVLLALLTPALDKAIHQAELAKCGAQQKSVAIGALAYATEQKRSFPHRPSFVALRRTEPAYLGRAVDGDDRPLIMPYMSLKVLLCPLAGGDKLDLSAEANDPETYLNPSYDLWYGWGYPNLQATRRLGDRFEWGGNRFSVLVSDRDAFRSDFYFSSHPDDVGNMVLKPAQNFDPYGAGGVESGALGKVTVSWWQGQKAGIVRGLIDRQVTYQDGSVERFLAVKAKDERMAGVPSWRNLDKVAEGHLQQLPIK